MILTEKIVAPLADRRCGKALDAGADRALQLLRDPGEALHFREPLGRWSEQPHDDHAADLIERTSEMRLGRWDGFRI